MHFRISVAVTSVNAMCISCFRVSMWIIIEPDLIISATKRLSLRRYPRIYKYVVQKRIVMP